MSDLEIDNRAKEIVAIHAFEKYETIFVKVCFLTNMTSSAHLMPM